jgi:hypothetical protein
MLMRSAAQSLTEQLAERFAARIRDRLLAPGSRLPSVRQCATQHQLSPSTVVAAYDQLLAQGLIEARPQRGFFVRDWTPKPALPSADGSPSAIDSRSFEAAGRAGGAGGADQGHGADPRHVSPDRFQAPARHGRLPARLAGDELHDGGGAQGHQFGGPAGEFAQVRRAAGRQRPAPRAVGAPDGAGPAGSARPDHHHRRRHARAGHREPHAAEGGRLRDGGGARMGRGVCAPRRAGHAHPARAAWAGRAGHRGHGTLLRGPCAQAVRQRERAAQPHRPQPHAGQCAPGAAAGWAVRLSCGGG